MTRNPQGRLEYAFKFATVCATCGVSPEELRVLTAITVKYYKASSNYSDGTRNLKGIGKLELAVTEQAAKMGWGADFTVGHWPVFRKEGEFLIVLPMP